MPASVSRSVSEHRSLAVGEGGVGEALVAAGDPLAEHEELGVELGHLALDVDPCRLGGERLHAVTTAFTAATATSGSSATAAIRTMSVSPTPLTLSWSSTVSSAPAAMAPSMTGPDVSTSSSLAR